jgi:hypothetical protein
LDEVFRLDLIIGGKVVVEWKVLRRTRSCFRSSIVSLHEAHRVPGGTFYQFQCACPEEWNQPTTGPLILTQQRLRAAVVK